MKDKLTKKEQVAIKCAHADLIGALQAKKQEDFDIHDWGAHGVTIEELEETFPFLPKNSRTREPIEEDECKKLKPTKLQQIIYEMLTESTGEALCDSGGAYGRNWERNQKRSIEDFINDPEMELVDEVDSEGIVDLPPDSSTLCATASLFHTLSSHSHLSIDEMCEEYNKIGADGNKEYTEQEDEDEDYIEENFNLIREGYTYNWSWNFSQHFLFKTLQKKEPGMLPGEATHVLISVHNGCDARAGFTDFRLFALDEYFPSWMFSLYLEDTTTGEEIVLDTHDPELYGFASPEDGFSSLEFNPDHQYKFIGGSILG